MAWWWALLSVPAFFVQTTIHEGAHGIFALMSGRTITVFVVWPHYLDHDDNPETRELFFWGRVRSKLKPGSFNTKTEKLLIHWAPWFIGIPVWLIYFAAIAFTPAPAWLFMFWGATTIDLSRGALQPLWRETRGDANKGAAVIGLGRRALQAIGASVAIGLVAGFVSVFVVRMF